MPFYKGHPNYITEKTKKKMSEARKGKTPKNIKFLNELSKNKNPEWIRKYSEARIGKPRMNMRGENHFNWKGGISLLRNRIQSLFKYRQWRSDVFTRDNFTCQICEIKADHYPKMFYKIRDEFNIKSLEDAENCEELWNINNGRTLCKNCHRKYGNKK